jgi:Cu(I)/Ag(I) efflux system membrane fusion protein
VGKVVADETRQRVITARVPGRIERLYVNSTGRQVRRGEKLADVYSPELYQASAELAAARSAARRGEPGAAANLHSVEERLRLWDLDPDQVAAAAGDLVTITAPLAGTVVGKDAVEGAYLAAGQPILTIADLGRVWVELDAYERDLIWLAEGQTATFSVTALPGEEFAGTIVFVDPLLDDRTRTIGARLEVDNGDGRLRPGMLARGRVQAELASDGRPRAGRVAAEAPLVVPATAPLLTGERAVVYLREPGAEPRFRGVDVMLGPRAGDWYVVRDGLAEGDVVVVNGAFKLDSALQIQARPSMMLPEEVEPLPTLPEVPACFVTKAPAVLAAYLELQMALANDDQSGAQATARTLQGSFSLHCREMIPDLVAAADAMVGADLAAMRSAFEPLSDMLWLTISAAGWDGDQPVRRFHCPMAFDDAGAHWLQLETTVANPYFGAMMLRCGGEVDRLGSEEDGS